MEKIDFFVFPFYKWVLPESIFEICLDISKSADYLKNQSNSTSKDLKNSELEKYLNQCLAELLDDLYPSKKTFSLVATEIWSNKSSFLEKHHKHSHPNSIYSGIIYLTDSPSGKTRFYTKNPWFYFEAADFIVPMGHTNPKTLTHFDYTPAAGEMIIFPSNTYHETLPNKDKTKERCTLAFNSFFKGPMGDDRKNNLDLNLN